MSTKIAGVFCRIIPDHRPGGLQHVTQERAWGLQEAGYNVTCITTSIPELPTEQQLTTVRINEDVDTQTYCTSSTPQIYSEEYARGCIDWVERNEPDLIVLESYDKHRTWWRDPILIGKYGKVVVALHGGDIGEEFTQYRIDRMDEATANKASINADSWKLQGDHLRTVDMVVGTSMWDAMMLRDLHHLHNAVLVYNPIPPYFNEDVDPTRGNDNTFGFFALHSQGRRGIRTLHRATKLRKNKEGTTLNILKGKKRTELPQEYDSLKALVVPSIETKGYDLVVAEALVRGTPVITSDVGIWWLEAQITPGIYFTHLDDAQQLADIMDTIQKGPIRERLQIHRDILWDRYGRPGSTKRFLDLLNIQRKRS